MIARIGVVALLTLLMAAGTWLIGWWAVPLVAVGCWLLRPGQPAWLAGLGAGLGWGLLLLLLPFGPLVRLDLRLASILHLPAWALPLLPLGYAALSGWSAARVTALIVGWRQGTRIAKVTTAPPGSRTVSSSMP